MTTSGQQGGTPWTSVGLIYNDSTFPPANTSVRMVARGSYKFPGGTLQATLRLQRRMVGGTTWTEIATITPPIAGTVVQGAFTITVPASTRGIQYRVEFPRSTIVGSTNPAYTNIITLYPGGLLTGVRISATPNPLLVSQRTTLTVATAPASAPNTTTQLQRQRAPGQWTLAGSAMPVRNTPGTETFRAVATQTGNGAGGPFTSPEITVRWLPALAIDPIADVTAYRGEPYPGTNQQPAATGGIAPLSYSLTGLPRGLNFNATSRAILPTTVPATTPLGAHSLTYAVADSAGNTASQSFTLTIRDRLRMTAPPPYVGSIGVAIPTQPNMPAATGGRAPYTYAWANLPSGVTGATAAGRPWYSGTPAEVGSFSATLTATDADGQTAPRLGSFVISNLDAPEPTAVAGDGQVVVSWGAVPQATGYAVRYASLAGIATRGAAAYSVPTLLASGARTQTIAGLTNGQPYRFQVRGRYGSVDGPWGEVDATPAAAMPPTAVPVITAQPAFIEGFPGTTGTYALQATQSGTGAYNLTYALSVSSGWHSITGSTLSYTLPTPTSYPNSDATGNYRDIQRIYTVSSDTVGVASVNGLITFRVRERPAPTVTPPALVAADQTVTVVAGATAIGELDFVDDADGNPQDGYGSPHSWTVASPPTGFSITNANWEWTNVPIAGQPHSLTYTVTDRLGQTDTGTITVNVTAPPSAFAIVGPDSVSGQVGESVEEGLVWRVINHTGVVTWTRPTNLPPGIGLNREGGIGRPDQWRATGNYESAVSDRATVFRAQDGASPPNTDDHTTTWNITARQPAPTGGRLCDSVSRGNETIRIVPITTPVRDEMIDGVRRLTYYYGTAPELEVSAELVSRCFAYAGARYAQVGPVYSMDITGADRVTGDANIRWTSQPINAVVGDQVGAINRQNLLAGGVKNSNYYTLRNYGQNTIPTYSGEIQNFYQPRPTLVIARPPTGRRSPADTVTARYPNDITYTARLYDHINSGRIRVPRYARHAADPQRSLPGRYIKYTNRRGGYRDFIAAKREIAEGSVIIRWIPEPLRFTSVLPAETILANGASAPELPGAIGGVPPYSFILHGDLPYGLASLPNQIDADGNRIGRPTPEPPVITGAVQSRGWGRWPLTMTVVDSAGVRGERQMIRMSWAWKTEPV